MSDGSGLVVLLGSGETSATGQKVFDWLFRRLSKPVHVAVLETPAGFELNSDQVAARIRDFLCHRLQNYDPQVTIVPARKRGTVFSPDDPAIADLIPGADAVVTGPGSPTYAVRQLQESIVWHTMTACHRLGSAMVLASATTIAASAQALPVYEIYKVGSDLHWCPGLDLFRPYGLSLVFIPHWNNNDGGDNLDTSRCYMGLARFEPLVDMLPSGTTVVGIDEHTALVVDPPAECCQVLGLGGVTLLRDGQEERFLPGQIFALDELGPFRQPVSGAGIPEAIWNSVQRAHANAAARVAPEPTAEVRGLVEERDAARAAKDWATADTLRGRIADLGWQVLDTPEGPRLEPKV